MSSQVVVAIEMVDKVRSLAEHLRADQAFVVLVLGMFPAMASKIVELVEGLVAKVAWEGHRIHDVFVTLHVRRQSLLNMEVFLADDALERFVFANFYGHSTVHDLMALK